MKNRFEVKELKFASRLELAGECGAEGFEDRSLFFFIGDVELARAEPGS